MDEKSLTVVINTFDKDKSGKVSRREIGAAARGPRGVPGRRRGRGDGRGGVCSGPPSCRFDVLKKLIRMDDDTDQMLFAQTLILSLQRTPHWSCADQTELCIGGGPNQTLD